MSVLDFLSPSLARDEGGFHPVARSAAERLFAAAGAIFDERDGWRVPTIVPDTEAHLETVGIADLSHVTKLEVRPAGAPVVRDRVVWYPLSARRALCFCHVPELPAVHAELEGRLVTTGAMLNVPAVAIVAAMTALCYRGISGSALVNSIIVATKVAVILLFIGFGLQFVAFENWQPFVPAPEGPGRFGWDGVVRGATIVFFAYLGFEDMANVSEETIAPERLVPVAIMLSVVLTAFLYVGIALAALWSRPANSPPRPPPSPTRWQPLGASVAGRY